MGGGGIDYRIVLSSSPTTGSYYPVVLALATEELGRDPLPGIAPWQWLFARVP